MSVYNANTANPKFNLFMVLSGVYGTLHLRAYQITSHDLAEAPPTMDLINRSIERWADRELKRSGETVDLTGAKRKVSSAFEELIKKHSQHLPPTRSRCRVCHSMLATEWFEVPLACETCVIPVHEAIDHLVRDSTKMFSPEELMHEWRSLMRRIEEARRNPLEKN